MNLEHFTKLQVKHYSTDPENVGSPEPNMRILLLGRNLSAILHGTLFAFLVDTEPHTMHEALRSSQNAIGTRNVSLPILLELSQNAPR